jgi:hypothetical protein
MTKESSMSVRDTLERLVWTMVAAFLGASAVGPVIDVSALEAGCTAAVIAAFNYLLLVARARLAVLPSPGEGLPGFPTEGGADGVDR